ncbi:MAG: OmpA family protein [Gammaproteobacteria bacterium]
MLTPTGPGKIKVLHTGRDLLNAELLNFDIDGDALKSAHTQYLEREAVPLLKGRDSRIWLQGSASRSGSEAHNMGLSERRVRGAANYLKSKGVGEKQMTLDYVGESLAEQRKHGREDPLDRAVAFLILPVAQRRTPAPQSGPPLNDRFKIKLLAGLSFGKEGGQADNLYFFIWDKENGLAAIYVYAGTGIGVSPIPVPLSATSEGPWNDFATIGKLYVGEFEGEIRFTTIGAGPWSKNYLTFKSLPRGIMTKPATLDLGTGFTYGAGASTTSGRLILPFASSGKNPGPYNGENIHKRP